MRLRKMTAIVTGGASSSGKFICHSLSTEGASIVVVEINLEGAKAVAADIIQEGVQAIQIKANVQSSEELHAMADVASDTFGKVNILVNNAGARIIKGFVERTAEYWNLRLWVNLSGAFFRSQAVVPKMIDSSGGSIINACSIASCTGRPNCCA